MKKVPISAAILFVAAIISGAVLQKTDAQVDIEACQKEYSVRRSQCISDGNTCSDACGENQDCKLNCNLQRNACEEAAVDQQRRCAHVWPYDGSSDAELPTVEIESTLPSQPASDSVSPVNIPDDSETLKVNLPPRVEQKTEGQKSQVEPPVIIPKPQEQSSLQEISSMFGLMTEIQHNFMAGDGHKNTNPDAILIRFSSEDSDIQLGVKFTPTKDITNGLMEADLVYELPEDFPPLSPDFRPIRYFSINQSDLFQDSQIGFEISVGIKYSVNNHFWVDLEHLSLLQLQVEEGDWKELTTTIEESDPFLWLTTNTPHFSYFAIAEKLVRKPMAWPWKIAVYLAIGLVIGAGYLVYHKKDILLKIIKKEPKQPL